MPYYIAQEPASWRKLLDAAGGMGRLHSYFLLFALRAVGLREGDPKGY
jgi:SH3-like domain-containing protein